jgi:type I restriction enzyme M protein
MSEQYKQVLQRQLWAIADILRGKMNADEFRNYILGFIFYKYLSEKVEIFADDLLEPDGIRFVDIDTDTEDGNAYIEGLKEEAIEKLGYFLHPNDLFRNIAAKGNSDTNDASSFIIEDLERILKAIETSTMGTESEEDMINLFEDMDLQSSKLGKNPEAKNDVISRVLSKLAQIDFRLKDANADLLGDAYEYLIGEFASGAGKKAGEFYTPPQVSTVLARIVTQGKTNLQSVYDPACGSGSLLLKVAKAVSDKGGQVFNFYGQEMNRTTYNLARMNMILHDINYRRFDLKQEDTLLQPQHDSELRFEAVVANPPFSAKWSPTPITINDERFSQYGKLAPKSKADFAFVQHMVHHLAENGTMAVVLPHGVLFRGAAEGHIRRYLIEDRNWLDAVIGLPANIFFGTSIPTCILVFKRCREHPDNILFVDASSKFEKGKNQNYLSNSDIDDIITAYEERTTQDKFAYVASLSEVAENDYNLNIPRYVDTFEPEPPVDLADVAAQLKALDKAMEETDSTIAGFCNQLGIDTPF